MAPRPIRSATISFGLVAIPVKFFTATKSEDIAFNMIHESCGSRINRKYWCPEHEEIVEGDELIRGYQISKGKFVTFTDEEIGSLESDDDRSLEITEFLDLTQIDPLYFEKAYYLGPGTGGSKTFRLLAAAMKKEGKVALARWVSNHREHLVVLRPFEDTIVLHTMYYADEVRDIGEVDVDKTEVKDKELKLAQMLIDELTEKKFDPLRYKDEYRGRVLEKIEAKSRGETILQPEKEEEQGGEVVDIMDALRRSLEGAQPGRSRRPSGARAEEKKPAAKKTAKKATPRATTARAGKRAAS